MEIVVGIVIFLIIIIAIGSLNKKTSKSSSPSSNYSVIDDVITIVGGFYRSYEAKKFIKTLSVNDIVYFLQEPDNPYDHDAVMVLSSTGLHIGYIPRCLAKDVKDELGSRNIEGFITYDAMGTYEFNIFLRPLGDIEERDSAIKIYTNRNVELKNKVTAQQKRESLGYFDIIYKVDTWYDMKQYDRVEAAIKPFFEANVQDSKCYELMIKICHVLKKYEEEEKLIDEYLVVNEYADKSYWKRRKFHILRAMGIIVSDEQIENEKIGVETTVIELDAFNIVVDLLSNDVDSNRIDFRDAQSLFAINLDGNTI